MLSVHLLLNEATQDFLGAERIAKMRAGAVLVNTARGAIVDEAAMVAALRSGHLRHAALDVFAEEPLPPGHVLTTLESVTLSAHSAFRTPEASETLIRRALDIARRVCGVAGWAHVGRIGQYMACLWSGHLSWLPADSFLSGTKWA